MPLKIVKTKKQKEEELNTKNVICSLYGVVYDARIVRGKRLNIMEKNSANNKH